MNVGLAVTRSARATPDAVAAFDAERTRTYAELDERTSRLANHLLAAFPGGRGERVALLCSNRMEVLDVLAGVAKAGMVYTGLNFRLGRSDLEAIMDNAEPVLVVTEGEHRELAEEVAGARGVPVVDLDDPGPHGFEALLAGASAATPQTVHEVMPGDEFCIVYTSGTTGLPKGILFDHAAATQHATVTCLEYGIGPDSRYLVQIPHNSSVNITIVPCLTVGAAVGFADSRGFEPERFAGTVQRRRVTHSFLVPTQLVRLLEQVHDPAPLASVHTLGYGASPIAPDRLHGLVERFGPVFIQLYGMAEIASIGTLLRKQDHVRALGDRPELLTSCGRPSYAMDVRVVDDDGRDVPPGERGEVVFAGPHAMRGYFRDPERTAETLRDGWVHSGDVGVFDDDGYLSIVDRLKNLIIRGGFNLAPSEIENVLSRHPAVLEAAVVGVPDPEWGEAVLAVVVRRDGAEVTGDDLVGWCRDSELTSIKVPERVEFRDALPRNAVGKIAKQELRAAYWTGDRRV